jgi:hypothetical protein
MNHTNYGGNRYFPLTRPAATSPEWERPHPLPCDVGSLPRFCCCPPGHKSPGQLPTPIREPGVLKPLLSPLLRFSRSTGGKKTRLRDRISPRAVRGYPGGGPRAVPGVPRASQRRKFVAEQLELLQPSLYEDQTLSKNRTVAPKRLSEGRPTLAKASAPHHTRLAGCSPRRARCHPRRRHLHLPLTHSRRQSVFSPHPVCGYHLPFGRREGRMRGSW